MLYKELSQQEFVTFSKKRKYRTVDTKEFNFIESELVSKFGNYVTVRKNEKYRSAIDVNINTIKRHIILCIISYEDEYFSITYIDRKDHDHKYIEVDTFDGIKQYLLNI